MVETVAGGLLLQGPVSFHRAEDRSVTAVQGCTPVLDPNSKIFQPHYIFSLPGLVACLMWSLRDWFSLFLLIFLHSHSS